MRRRIWRSLGAEASYGRRWSAALAEHRSVVRSLIETIGAIEPTDWWREPSAGKWTPAAVVLHVCIAYELGREAARGGPGMRLRVSAPVAWILRSFMLPMIFATKRFPTGAVAPREVRPDTVAAQRLTKNEASSRLERVAADAAEALRAVSEREPGLRFVHAYFGPLAPLTALKLLSAHTRHHTRLLRSNPSQS
jgi:hypothetical protein